MVYLQIVPGYYVRRDIKGQIENSAAMNNTASEHFMVDRLIVDDLLNWAVNYKVSGQWYQYSNYWHYIMIIPVISDLMAHPRYAQKNSCIHAFMAESCFFHFLHLWTISCCLLAIPFHHAF
jgi:hypothetical protein